MGSTLMLNVRIYCKSFQPFCQQGCTAFLTSKTQSQLLSSARFLCTGDSKFGGREVDRRNRVQTVGQVRIKNNRRQENEVEGRGTSCTLRQRPSFPKSVFVAGTAKKTAEMLSRKTSVVAEHEDRPEQRTLRGAGRIQPPDRPLSAAEWKKIKESHGNSPRFDIQMINTLLTSGAQLDIVKSLLTFVAMETGTLSYELLLRYLTLCVSGGHDAEVFDLYDIMRRNFPTLDTGASSLFIKSFCQTSRWREAISVLDEVKKVFSPSTRNYDNIIAAAVLHGDMTTAWALYDELVKKELNPFQETWGALFQGASKTREEEGEGISQAEQQERLLGILMHMRNNQIYPQLSLARNIKTWFESLTGQKWTGSWTSASPTGLCRCCGSNLESIHLTAEEYEQLKNRVMTDIIQGSDVFNKTTPAELQQFKVFVQRKPAFDVVVDGLNVANTNSDKSKLSETLLAVVSELQGQGLTVLVLGRKHMLRHSRSWQRHNMNLIRQKAHCFFTENISEDDPFLLYATLHSGNRCLFVSRDLMRDHKACLPDEATRRLFFKWQRGHQLVVAGYLKAGKKVRFQSIPSYDTIVQTSGDSWHVPYDNTEDDRSTYEVPQQWLCLTKKN